MSHELKRRSLDVVAVERFTPHMIRVTLRGAELADFVSDSPDDHIKIFVPGLDGAPTRRDYTPRRFDRRSGTLVLDFVNHDGGPAAAWARAATVGDRLEIGGPRGSQVIARKIDHWLLVADETALPAIGRRIEELTPQASVVSVVAVPGADDEQVLETQPNHHAYWVHRPLEDADQASAILDVLKTIEIHPRTFVWVGAEARVSKAIRQYLLDERKIPAQWIKASGHWVNGQADASVKDVGDER